MKVAIIGAGHNGLVAACYLARAGYEVTIFEQCSVVGGLCITEQLFPGYEVSTIAGKYGMLRPEIIEDLELEKHGLSTFITNPISLVLFPDGKYSITWSDLTSKNNLGPFSNEDIRGWSDLHREINAAARIIKSLLLKPPIPKEQIRQILRSEGYSSIAEAIFDGSMLHFAKKYLNNESLITLAAGLSQVVPTLPLSVFARVYSATAETNRREGIWASVKGGMGAVTAALARAANSLGVKILVDQPVAQVSVHNGKACGIELKDGKKLSFDLMVSNIDPMTTFIRLLPKEPVTERLKEKMIALDHGVFTGLRVHLALSKLPELTAEIEPEHQHKGLLLILPSLVHLESMHDQALKGQLPAGNTLSMRFESATDDVAPPGKHLLSISCNCIPTSYQGKIWDETSKHVLLDYILSLLQPHMPSLRESIENWHVIGPDDYKKRWGIESLQGHMPWTSIFEDRPTPELAHYETPIENFFLCGSGTHPGPNVTGACGYICANKIIDKTNYFRSRKPSMQVGS